MVETIVSVLSVNPKASSLKEPKLVVENETTCKNDAKNIIIIPIAENKIILFFGSFSDFFLDLSIFKFDKSACCANDVIFLLPVG